MASLATSAARKTFRELQGVVVTAGLMEKTVKVRVGGLKWNNFLKKHFSDPKTYLVHDPNNSLRAGDVVAISPGWRTSQHKRHVIKHIIKPSGVPIEDRPPILSQEELSAEREAAQKEKQQRRALKREVEAAETALQRAERMVNVSRKEIAARTRMIGGGRPAGALTDLD